MVKRQRNTDDTVGSFLVGDDKNSGLVPYRIKSRIDGFAQPQRVPPLHLRNMLGWHSAPVLDDLSEYDVVPVPLLHIHPGSEDAMLTTGLLIYGQLDTGKLRSALKDLARLGEWRKIGCRMRRAATVRFS